MDGYSQLFKNIPQFVVIHTVKGFSINNEAIVIKTVILTKRQTYRSIEQNNLKTDSTDF